MSAMHPTVAKCFNSIVPHKNPAGQLLLFPYVFTGVLQRNKTNGMCVWVCTHLCVFKEIYYKGSAYAIWKLTSPKINSLQAGDPEKLIMYCKSKNWQAWDLGRANVLVQVWQQKETNVPAQRQSSTGILYYWEESQPFFSYSGLQWIGWEPLTLRRAICFT